jgi:hypothetical protein
MAQMVGVWMYVAPRNPSDDVNILCGGTMILSKAEREQIGDSLMTVSIRVMDYDPGPDDLVHVDNSFQLGPALLKIGPTAVGVNVIVPHSEVQSSEPFYEKWAELYVRVRASGGGVTTNWADSLSQGHWDVKYK